MTTSSTSLSTLVQRFLSQEFTDTNWRALFGNFYRATRPHLRILSPGDTVHMYTDGSCKGNPGPGGWAALVCTHSHYNQETCVNDLTIAGKMPSSTSTSPRCELMAVIKGFELLKRLYTTTIPKLIVHSDCLYVVNGAKGAWKRKTNVDLWKRLLREAENVAEQLEYVHVRGHSGDPHNERVDKLARACLD